MDCLTLLFSLHIKSPPRVKAFFALTLLVSLIAQTPKGCQVFENKRFQIHFTLDTILCLCSHEDKNKKKKFCSQFEQNSFYTQSELTPRPTSSRTPGFGACVAPKVFCSFLTPKKNSVLIFIKIKGFHNFFQVIFWINRFFKVKSTFIDIGISIWIVF